MNKKKILSILGVFLTLLVVGTATALGVKNYEKSKEEEQKAKETVQAAGFSWTAEDGLTWGELTNTQEAKIKISATKEIRYGFFHQKTMDNPSSGVATDENPLWKPKNTANQNFENGNSVASVVASDFSTYLVPNVTIVDGLDTNNPNRVEHIFDGAQIYRTVNKVKYYRHDYRTRSGMAYSTGSKVTQNIFTWNGQSFTEQLPSIATTQTLTTSYGVDNSSDKDPNGKSRFKNYKLYSATQDNGLLAYKIEYDVDSQYHVTMVMKGETTGVVHVFYKIKNLQSTAIANFTPVAYFDTCLDDDDQVPVTAIGGNKGLTIKKDNYQLSFYMNIAGGPQNWSAGYYERTRPTNATVSRLDYYIYDSSRPGSPVYSSLPQKYLNIYQKGQSLGTPLMSGFVDKEDGVSSTGDEAHIPPYAAGTRLTDERNINSAGGGQTGDTAIYMKNQPITLEAGAETGFNYDIGMYDSKSDPDINIRTQSDEIPYNTPFQIEGEWWDKTGNSMDLSYRISTWDEGSQSWVVSQDWAVFKTAAPNSVAVKGYPNDYKTDGSENPLPILPLGKHKIEVKGKNNQGVDTKSNNPYPSVVVTVVASVTEHFIDTNNNPVVVNGVNMPNNVVPISGTTYQATQNVPFGYIATGYKVGATGNIITSGIAANGKQITGEITGIDGNRDIYYIYKKVPIVTEIFVNEFGDKLVETENQVEILGTEYSNTVTQPNTAYEAFGYKVDDAPTSADDAGIVKNTVSLDKKNITGSIQNVTTDRKIYYIFTKTPTITEMYVDELGNEIQGFTTTDIESGGSYSKSVAITGYTAHGYKVGTAPTGATDPGIIRNTVSGDKTTVTGIINPVTKDQTIYYVFRKNLTITEEYYRTDGVQLKANTTKGVGSGGRYEETKSVQPDLTAYLIVGYMIDGGPVNYLPQPATEITGVIENVTTNHTIRYYFWPKGNVWTVTEKYIDKNGNAIPGMTDTYVSVRDTYAYANTIKAPKGYKITGYIRNNLNLANIKTDGNDTVNQTISGSFAANITANKTIYYVFEKISSSDIYVTEHFVDEDGNPIDLSDNIMGPYALGGTYSVNKTPPSGYEAVGYKLDTAPNPRNIDGQLDRDIITSTVNPVTGVIGATIDRLTQDRDIYYVYRKTGKVAVSFYVRQYLRQMTSEIPTTPNGYIAFNNRDTTGASAVTKATYQTEVKSVTSSTETNSAADYTKIDFYLNSATDKGIFINPIVPEHYKVVGYLLTSNPAQNLSTNPTLMTTNPDFTMPDTGNVYVTIVLEPIGQTSPPMFNWDYKLNSLGVIKK